MMINIWKMITIFDGDDDNDDDGDHGGFRKCSGDADDTADWTDYNKRLIISKY